MAAHVQIPVVASHGLTERLDRVLLHKYIVVPHWYSATHRVAYRNRFGIPQVAPKYYQADPYVISSWWQVKPRKTD